MLLKVCCVQSEAELEMAVEAGATHVGLVGAMPSGPGCLDDDRIAELVSAAHDGVRPVLLTAEVESDAIVEHVERASVGVVQIVSPVPAKVRTDVRRLLTELEIIQVVHVEGPGSVTVAREAAEGSDMLLLDSGRPSAATPELGGTGRVHDWSVSAEVVAGSPVPVLLAGGLDPANASDAVRTVRPAGLDVCSGLRDRTGRLEADKLAAFAAAMQVEAVA